MWWLALLFTVVPLVDLWLLLLIGGWMGFWPTVALTIGAALLGGYLGKREGLKVLRNWGQAVAGMRVPEEGILSGALVLAGAVLLAAPGVLTDVVGLGLLFPPTRKLVAKGLRHVLKKRFAAAVAKGRIDVRVVTSGGPIREETVDSRGRDVIDAEAEVIEEEPKRLAP